jgi:hypothetical protein
VTFPAANLGLFYILLGFPAVGTDLDLEGKERKRPLEFRSDLHMLTGIGSQDSWNGAAAA